MRNILTNTAASIILLPAMPFMFLFSLIKNPLKQEQEEKALQNKKIKEDIAILQRQIEEKKKQQIQIEIEWLKSQIERKEKEINL